MLIINGTWLNCNHFRVHQDGVCFADITRLTSRALKLVDDIRHQVDRDGIFRATLVEKINKEAKYVEEVVEEDTDDYDEVLAIFTAKVSGKDGRNPIHVSVMLDRKSFKMQLDTGATVSILPKALYDQHFSQWPLCSTKIKLQAYNSVRIPVQELVLPLMSQETGNHQMV